MSVGTAKPTGMPYPSNEAGPVDRWSLDVFTALKDWPPAREGVWSRWDPGYLLLEITSAAGEPIEPIVLYTADEEIMVEFGLRYEAFLADCNTAGEAAEGAIDIIQEWLSGELKTLIFRNAAGEWCCTTTISPGDITEQIIQEFGKHGDLAGTAELCTARRRDCRTFRLVGDRLIES